MCYSASISFFFTVVGLLTAAWIAKDPKSEKLFLVPLLFYTLMEFLQTVQYFYVNQCSSTTNNFLTEIAYVLVIVQPLMWNLFFYYRSEKNGCDRKIFSVGIAFAALWMMVDVLSRFMYHPQNKIKQRAFSPPNNTKYRACTRSIGSSHLFWNWTSADFQDLNANYLMYLMIWFIPALLTTTQRSQSLLMILCAAVGFYISYISGNVYTFPSVWCYISVPMIIVLLYDSLRSTPRLSGGTGRTAIDR